MAFQNFLDVTDEDPAQRLFSNLIKNEVDSTETCDPLSQLFPSAPEASLPTLQVTPQPGFCVKTWEISGEKVFLNVCHCDQIPAPPPQSEECLKEMLNSPDVVNYKVPLSIGPLHREMDKGGAPCQVYDVIINTEFYLNQVAKSDIFADFITQVALQGLEEKYKLTYKDDNTWVKLKNKKYFGSPALHTIQDRSRSPFTQPSSSSPSSVSKKSRPLIEDITEQSPAKIETISTGSPAGHKPETKSQRFQVIDKADREIPSYKVFLFPSKGYPTHLKYLIELPRIKESSHVMLEVCPNRLLLTSFCYGLELDLPYLVMKDEVQALFNSSTHVLLVTLPIIPSSKQD